MCPASRGQGLSRHRFARCRSTLTLALAAALLAGCAAGGARSQLSAPVQNASSAMETARLAFDQYAKADAPVPFAAVTLEDAHTELDTAETTASSLTLPQRRDAELQDRVVAELQSGLAAVLAAQRVVAGGGSAAAKAAAGLDAAADRIRRLANLLEPGR